MPTKAVALLSEAESQELESFLADRIYEFNSQATGYFDGKLLAGSIRDDAAKVIAGFSGHTWGGCCHISLGFSAKRICYETSSAADSGLLSTSSVRCHAD